MARLVGLKAKLAGEVRSYCDGRSDREACKHDLCEVLSRVLAELLQLEKDWDSKYTWLDGILPQEVRTDGAEVEIVGGACVVNRGRTTMWPVRAILRADEAGARLQRFDVLFGDRRSSPALYDASFKLHRLRMPENPEDWAFALDGAAPS